MKKGLFYLGFILLLVLVLSFNLIQATEGVIETTNNFDYRGNLIFQEIDANGFKIGVIYDYDEQNRRVKLTSLYKEIEYFYDEFSNIIYQSIRDFGDNNTQLINFSYSSGNTYVTDYENNGAEFSYNSDGLLYTFSLGNYIYSYNYDEHDNLISSCIQSIISGLFECENYNNVYNGQGLLLSDDDYSYEYYPNNNLKKKIFNENESEQYYYDTFGKVIKKVYVDSGMDSSYAEYALIPGDESSFVSEASLEYLKQQLEYCTDFNNVFSSSYVVDAGLFYNDFCEDSNNLVEYYCGFNIFQFRQAVKDKSRYCEYGCLDGKCLNETQTMPVIINYTNITVSIGGLISYYSFDDNSYGNIIPNYENIIPHGPVSYVPGVVGEAIYLNNSYLEISKGNIISYLDNYSISFYFSKNPNFYRGYGGIYSESNFNGAGFGFRVDNMQAGARKIVRLALLPHQDSSIPQYINDTINTWHHVVVVKENTDSYKVYLDGFLAFERASMGYMPGDIDTSFIGAMGVSTPYQEVARELIIDELKIFGKVLSMQEINELSGQIGIFNNEIIDLPPEPGDINLV